MKERKIKHLRYARDNARVRIYKVIIEEEKRERERWKLGNVGGRKVIQRRRNIFSWKRMRVKQYSKS